MKVCTKCNKQKPLSEFHKDKTHKSGLNYWCKTCRKNNDQKYYQTHKIKYIKYAKDYRKTHKIEHAKYARKHRKTIIGCLRTRFQQIKHRCNNPKDISYKYYGGRGIKCLFKNTNEFVDYVINELQADPRKLQIDRINNDDHYKPGNIRLVTQIENLRNKRKK